jgi:2-phospho-L-lactate/phosphoenolpyruvate guanylyltransferase
MTPSTWALVPIRSFSGGKRRLATHLDDAQRAGLGEAMARRILRVLLAHPGLAGVAVVSADASVRAWAEAAGATAFNEPGAGLNVALGEVARKLQRAGATSLLVVPADVPGLDAADVSALLDAPQSVVLVAAARDGGTNALKLTPPTLMPFCFGRQSAAAYRATAIARGWSLHEPRLPKLSIDVDVADDLLTLPAELRALLREAVPV